MCTVEENWSYEVNLEEIETNRFFSFESQIQEVCECILKLLQNRFLALKYDSNHTNHNYDDDLKTLLEQNKCLRQEIEVKVVEVQRQQALYETFKNDQKLLSQEIKDKHEAFLMARKYYKKFLKIYHTIETKKDDKQYIFVQFFTETKKDSENYSVRLMRNSSSYELLSTNPTLKNFKDIQNKLQEANDITGALCCIRQSFKVIKKCKNLNK